VPLERGADCLTEAGRGQAKTGRALGASARSAPGHRAHQPQTALDRGRRAQDDPPPRRVDVGDRLDGDDEETSAKPSGSNCERIRPVGARPVAKLLNAANASTGRLNAETLAAAQPVIKVPLLRWEPLAPHRGFLYSSTTRCCSVEEQEREAGLPRNDYILAVAPFMIALAAEPRVSAPPAPLRFTSRGHSSRNTFVKGSRTGGRHRPAPNDKQLSPGFVRQPQRSPRPRAAPAWKAQGELPLLRGGRVEIGEPRRVCTIEPLEDPVPREEPEERPVEQPAEPLAPELPPR
jgi:hypothetical protein